jgi:acetyl-CoA carboxylase biotin carboxyl carrier protein
MSDDPAMRGAASTPGPADQGAAAGLPGPADQGGAADQPEAGAVPRAPGGPDPAERTGGSPAGGPDATAHRASPRPGRSGGDAGDASLLALVDRLTVLLERSELAELEVEVGGTGLVLRKPGAIPGVASSGAPGAAHGLPGGPSPVGPGQGATPASGETSSPSRLAVRAPLTGIFYSAPAPGSAPYVRVGGEVATGQVIGLIEAMKLFNEIKSDLSGRVVRVVAENGQLVKARQPLIEVEPL